MTNEEHILAGKLLYRYLIELGVPYAREAEAAISRADMARTGEALLKVAAERFFEMHPLRRPMAARKSVM